MTHNAFQWAAQPPNIAHPLGGSGPHGSVGLSNYFGVWTLVCYKYNRLLEKKRDNEVKKTSYGVLRENADGNDTVPISV